MCIPLLCITWNKSVSTYFKKISVKFCAYYRSLAIYRPDSANLFFVISLLLLSATSYWISNRFVGILGISIFVWHHSDVLSFLASMTNVHEKKNHYCHGCISYHAMSHYTMYTIGILHVQATLYLYAWQLCAHCLSNRVSCKISNHRVHVTCIEWCA